MQTFCFAKLNKGLKRHIVIRHLKSIASSTKKMSISCLINLPDGDTTTYTLLLLQARISVLSQNLGNSKCNGRSSDFDRLWLHEPCYMSSSL